MLDPCVCCTESRQSQQLWRFNRCRISEDSGKIIVCESEPESTTAGIKKLTQSYCNWEEDKDITKWGHSRWKWENSIVASQHWFFSLGIFSWIYWDITRRGCRWESSREFQMRSTLSLHKRHEVRANEDYNTGPNIWEHVIGATASPSADQKCGVELWILTIFIRFRGEVTRNS